MSEWRFDIMDGSHTWVNCPECGVAFGIPLGLRLLTCPACAKAYAVVWHQKKRSVYLQSDVIPIDELIPAPRRTPDGH